MVQGEKKTAQENYRAQGYNPPPPQIRNVFTETEVPDNRDRFRANQAQQAENDRRQFLNQQQETRDNILSGQITPNKSDFTGYTDGLFGLRAGNYQDRKETDPSFAKVREGLTSPEYADYMSSLYEANPAQMEELFPVGSGALARKVFTPTPIKALGSMLGDTTGAAGKKINSFSDLMRKKLDNNVDFQNFTNDLMDAPSGLKDDFLNFISPSSSNGILDAGLYGDFPTSNVPESISALNGGAPVDVADISTLQQAKIITGINAGKSFEEIVKEVQDAGGIFQGIFGNEATVDEIKKIYEQKTGTQVI